MVVIHLTPVFTRGLNRWIFPGNILNKHKYKKYPAICGWFSEDQWWHLHTTDSYLRSQKEQELPGSHLALTFTLMETQTKHWKPEKLEYSQPSIKEQMLLEGLAASREFQTQIFPWCSCWALVEEKVWLLQKCWIKSSDSELSAVVPSHRQPSCWLIALITSQIRREVENSLSWGGHQNTDLSQQSVREARAAQQI